MDKPIIETFFIANKGGVPELTIDFTEGGDTKVDDVLFSGFVVALIQFLSEILSAKEQHTQFAQESYEGVIAAIGDDHLYCVVGKNLFQYPFIFYKTVFSFIEWYFFNDVIKREENKEENVRELLNWIFHSFSNVDLLIPKNNEKEDKQHIWSVEAESVFSSINGIRNIKELALATELEVEEVFAIVMVFSWLQMTEINLVMREYQIFQRTFKTTSIAISMSEEIQTLESTNPKTVKVLNAIDGNTNIRELKEYYPELDIDNILLTLIEYELIEPVSKNRIIELLIFNYMSYIWDELKNILKTGEAQEFLRQVFRETKTEYLYSLENGEIGFFTIHDSLEGFMNEGYAVETLLNMYLRPVYLIEERLRKQDRELSTGLFGIVISRILEKHGFTLERMGLLDLFCPETFLE